MSAEREEQKRGNDEFRKYFVDSVTNGVKLMPSWLGDLAYCAMMAGVDFARSNIELSGAAGLCRAASSDRREGG